MNIYENFYGGVFVKKILAVLLSVTMLLGAFPSLSVMVRAEGDVVCADGNQQR